jgi:hypothetical protein
VAGALLSGQLHDVVTKQRNIAIILGDHGSNRDGARDSLVEAV